MIEKNKQNNFALFIQICKRNLHTILSNIFYEVYADIKSEKSTNKKKDLCLISHIVILLEGLNQFKNQLSDKDLENLSFNIDLDENEDHDELKDNIMHHTQNITDSISEDLNGSNYRTNHEHKKKVSESYIPDSLRHTISQNFSRSVVKTPEQEQSNINHQINSNTDGYLTNIHENEDPIQYVDKLVHQKIQYQTISKTIYISSN